MRFPDVEPFKEEALPEDGKKAALKVLEESAELVEAVKGWLSADATVASMTPDHMLEEMGDVLQAVGNLAEVLGLNEDHIQWGYDRAYAKNGRKDGGRYDIRE